MLSSLLAIFSNHNYIFDFWCFFGPFNLDLYAVGLLRFCEVVYLIYLIFYLVYKTIYYLLSLDLLICDTKRYWHNNHNMSNMLCPTYWVWRWFNADWSSIIDKKCYTVYIYRYIFHPSWNTFWGHTHDWSTTFAIDHGEDVFDWFHR